MCSTGRFGIFWQNTDHRLASLFVIGHGYKPFLLPVEPAGQLRGLFSGSALGQLFTMVFASYQATVNSGSKQGKLNTSLATGLWTCSPCRPSRELTVDDTFHQTGDTHPLGFFQISLRMQWDTPSILKPYHYSFMVKSALYSVTNSLTTVW